jgi:cell division septum initiation protein DivIVA
MSDSETTEIQALYAINRIEEEAADKRKTVSADTVKEAVSLFNELIESDTQMDARYLKETRDDLKSIHKLVDGAPKKKIDHLAVSELSTEFEKRLFELGILE